MAGIGGGDRYDGHLGRGAGGYDVAGQRRQRPVGAHVMAGSLAEQPPHPEQIAVRWDGCAGMGWLGGSRMNSRRYCQEPTR